MFLAASLHTHTFSKAACVSFSSLWQRVTAVCMLHCSRSSHKAWPSNTAFQWWLQGSTCTEWLTLFLDEKVSFVYMLLLEWLRQRQQPKSSHQPPTGTLTGHSQVTGEGTTTKVISNLNEERKTVTLTLLGTSMWYNALRWTGDSPWLCLSCQLTDGRGSIWPQWHWT